MTRNPWLVFAVVGINVFMATLDGSAVNLILPAISTQFNAPLTRVEWVSTIYLLVISVSLLPVGAIAPRFGERRLFSLGILLFTIASVLCALSTSLASLVLARMLQGVGAALTSALGAGFIASAFPEERRGMALGMVGSTVAAGSLTGPLLGGFLAGKLGWPTIFWLNLPIGIIALIFATRWLPVDVKRPARPFDHYGAGLSGSALILLLLALSEWNHTSLWLIIVALVAAFVLGIWFFVHQHRTEHPLLPLTVFQERRFTAATVAGLLNTMATMQGFFTMPFYLHTVKDLNLVSTGMYMVFWPLSLAVVGPLAGRAADRFGARWPALLGPILQACSYFLMMTLEIDSPGWFIAMTIALGGAGGAMFVPANNSTLLNSVAKKFLFIASSMLALIRNIGMVSGIAISAAAVQLFRLLDAHPDTPAGFLTGMHHAMWIAAILVILSGLTSLIFSKPSTPLRGS